MDDTTQSKSKHSLSRRKALAGGAGLLATGLAGCTSMGGGNGGNGNGEGSGGGDGSNEGANGDGPTLTVASFFSFYDFARNIVDGTPLQVENLVPTGLHGHGWQPSAEVTQQIIESDAFLHVGPGFQPWADRAIQTLKDDNIDVHLINAREGVDLLPLAETLDPEEEGVGEGQGLDPHFWLDPERGKTSVDNIAEGMAEIAPDHESALMDNAETYKADVLEQVRQDFQAMFEESDRDVVQLAAHNAFQYWADAYGTEMRPLVTNLAASGNVAPEDITEAQQVIKENDISYIANGVFEARRPAAQLIEETQAEAYFPVTPYAGVREDWVENNWGYKEVAYQINKPTLEICLGNKTPEEAGPDGWTDQWMNFE